MKNKLKIILPIISCLLLVSCNKKHVMENYPAYYLTDKFEEKIELPDINQCSKTTISDQNNTYREYSYNPKEGYNIITEILNKSTIYDMEGCNGFWYQNIRYKFNDNTYIEVAIDDNFRFTTTIIPSYTIYIKGTNLKNKGNYYNCFFRDEDLYNKLLSYYNASLKVAGEKITDYSL